NNCGEIQLANIVYCKKTFLLSLTMNKNIYSLAFSRSRDFIIIADCHHQIIEVNPATITTFGYSREELLKMSLDDLFSDSKVGLQFIKDICKKDFIVHQELMFRQKNGEVFPVLINADKIDEESEIFMVVAKNVKLYKQE